MTRLKYVKIGRELHTVNDILCDTKLVKVIAHIPTLTFIVCDINSKVVLHEESLKSLAALKKRVKIVLRSLGADFDDEIRSKEKKL